MDVKFFIPSDELIPTRLRLTVDGSHVYYERVHDKFAYDFTLYDDAAKNYKAIVDEIVKTMCEQSYDHGSEWRESRREIISRSEEWYEPVVVRVYFHVKDSY